MDHQEAPGVLWLRCGAIEPNVSPDSVNEPFTSDALIGRSVPEC